MKKKLLSALLCTVFLTGIVAGCGQTTSGDATKESETKTAVETGGENTAESETTVEVLPDEGKVLNIYGWNEEFKTRVTDHYAAYTAVDGTTGTIGDVTVKWNITPNENNAYQNNLDETLLRQADAAADDKIDIFLVEADYALKYVDTEYTMPIADLGITEADIANQYKYTKDIVTDSNGVLKGLSWQGCPGALFYNREIAKLVLGTDDPAAVQAAVADWKIFGETAKVMAEHGYSMMASANDTYRVYSNNVSAKWVVDGKINIDENLMNWVEDSKAMVDAGYTGTFEMWSDDWSRGFYPAGMVFSYFGPAWLVNFSMAADVEGSVANMGGWAATEGPQSFFWGGTWICAATGTDNPGLIKDIMLTLTTNEEVMTNIVKQDDDFVNNKPAMEAMAVDVGYQSKVLGGQNPLAMYAKGAENIDLSNLSPYDQGCNEEFQRSMKNYFDGNATLDEALDLFYKAVEEKYPGLTH